jgi:nicotinamidase/pyrazinamidase
LAGLRQELWPPHCIQGTPGAAFHKDVAARTFAKVFHKGTDPAIDSYSAFFDNAHRRSTGLGEFVKDRDVGEVYLLGLATDFCVKFSVLDAVKLGLRTFVVEDGCRGIDLQPGDAERALAQMQKAGASIVKSGQVK